jgi:hypothetical protein
MRSRLDEQSSTIVSQIRARSIPYLHAENAAQGITEETEASREAQAEHRQERGLIYSEPLI